MKRLLVPFAMLACTLAAIAAPAQRTAETRRNGPADLADAVAGSYRGDVISDARGSSRSDVTVSVVKVGPNLVEIRSDYSRIPTVRIPLTQAMSAIIAARGDHVFLIDRDRDARRLDLTIDDASLSLHRQ